MTQEALKLALGQLQAGFVGNAMQILREALAEHAMQEVQRLGQEIEQEPVGMVKDLFTSTAWERLDLRGSTKVYLAIPPQRTEQEPVAWPCLIDSADFSENTITLVMQCEDYKVSAGTHWLSTTPPKETK